MNARALTLLATLGWAVAVCSSSDTTTSTTSSSASGTGGGGAGGAGSGGEATTTSTSSAATSSGSSSSTGMAEPMEAIHFLGRFDMSDPQAPSSAWPGSAIATRFSGTGLDVDLHDDGKNFFAVSIDGKPPTVLATTKAKDTYTLASGLPDGEHDAVLFRRTESFQGVVHFHGFKAAGGKALIPTPAPFKRRIELIGDSITCGYGNEGAGPSCGFTPDTENEWMAYGAITARDLAAEPHVIAYSGKGAYRDYSGNVESQMPELYERVFAEDPAKKWDFSTWTADVVVVNLGTNDFAKGDPGQPYVDAYTGLVKQIRGHYPDAYIVCAVGSMLGGVNLAKDIGYVQGVVKAANDGGDAKVSFVDLGQQDANANGLGCDYHPSVKTDQVMATKLTAAIKTVTGW
jgi:lysophospholipase L1-like esterase